MKVSKKMKLVLGSFLLVLATGCSSVSPKEDMSSMDGMNNMDGAKKEVSSIQVQDIQSVFYFGFDQSIVNVADMQALKMHSQYLMANPDVRLRLEGHADERGTREYNMALGERRAMSVGNVLMANGVQGQLETISYGEEKPVMMGHNDESWDKNRRVELKYMNN